VSPVAHELHVTPPVPHCEFVSLPYRTHVLPLQQPLGHELALHSQSPGETHAWFAPHAAQAAPPVPHEGVDCEEKVSHAPIAPPLQQPPGHVWASQEHVPFVVSQSP
jgi:hypothetical protein